jgi:hypothetical protein
MYMEKARLNLWADKSEAEQSSPVGLGTEIAALFHEIGLDEDLPELSGFEVKPVDFAE